jgi:hypothetical protein
VPDRNGKIFYTSITSLSHISKKSGNETNAGVGRLCVHPCAEFAEKTKLRNRVDFGRKIKIKKVKKVVDR